MHVLNRRVFETDDIVSMSRELSRHVSARPPQERRRDLTRRREQCDSTSPTAA
ncbi:hypothetical protein EMIHUDRAFT_308883 [Emiliania huxleyi CCMP1516]|uniref:Uncharacterized protein n=2 Tax=Emiliania huxleyi TaxID=2903 RepID=A0A0D3I784_EMIH1|nr:hypothetical protein EMIHUDRAFT_308883 [Emiliania huxleyi CCMP1516]EOD07119.1 hypothetical protein EMIHUDRAFT_308883 [Emiliania huxleyi CCMP1516]|eukprot:XP_005759548.1 hypothetical protein EMIHUDRAFT_308883 [Emiliania huxleyi CCMP1516]